MFWSSMPVGRPIFSTRSFVTYTAFTTMASVRAICTATRMAPARLRSSAERMGRISMLLSLQIGSRRRAPDAPGRVQPRHEAGEHGDGDDQQEIHGVERQDAARGI